MKTLQLELDLAPRAAPARQRPVIERLRAVLKRQGIEWQYPPSTRVGSRLLRPLLGARSPYEPLCGRYGCGDITFARAAYCDRPPLDREEAQSWSQWQTTVYRACHHELWGNP